MITDKIPTEATIPSLSIEGTHAQVQAIQKHGQDWHAIFTFNNQYFPLEDWGLVKKDKKHSALSCPLCEKKPEKREPVLKNFGAAEKDLTFFVGNPKAKEVLKPLIKNGMKVKIVVPGQVHQEYFVKKPSINFKNKN